MLNNKKTLLITLVCAGLSTNLMLANGGDTVAADATVTATAPSFDPAAKQHTSLRTATPPAAQPSPVAAQAPQPGIPVFFDPATKPAGTATTPQAAQVQPQLGVAITDPTKTTTQPIAAPVAPTAPVISAPPLPAPTFAVAPSMPPANAAPQMCVAAPMAPGFPMAFGHPMAYGHFYGHGKHASKMHKSMSKRAFKHHKNPLKFAKRTFMCRLLGLPTPQAQMAMQQRMLMGSFQNSFAAPAMIAVR